MLVIETERLLIQKFALEDAPFIFTLLNDPSFIKNIRYAGIKTIADAENYLKNVPLKSYEQHGHGLYKVALKVNNISIGMCGLIKRESLSDVDIGYAFLPEYTGKGYAIEAAKATIDYGKTSLNLKRIVAITSPDNEASIKVLLKLGMKFEGFVKTNPDDIDLKLFA